MVFGKRLRELRMERKLSQRDLGKYLKVAPSTIAMYETGKREPDFETVSRVAEYFGVATDYLLGQTDVRAKAAVVDLSLRWPNLSPDRRQRAYQMEQAAKGMPDTYIHVPKDISNETFDAIMKSFGSLFEVISAAKKPDQS